MYGDTPNQIANHDKAQLMDIKNYRWEKLCRRLFQRLLLFEYDLATYRLAGKFGWSIHRPAYNYSSAEEFWNLLSNLSARCNMMLVNGLSVIFF